MISGLSINAKATSSYVVSPDNFINITTVDENGNTPENAHMELRDAKGNVVVSWDNNGSNVEYASDDNKIVYDEDDGNVDKSEK